MLAKIEGKFRALELQLASIKFRLLNRHLRFVRQECDVDLFEGFDLSSGKRLADFIEQLLRAYWRLQA